MNVTGSNGPTTWPPRTPHLTQRDLFLCRYIKDAVYVPTLPTTSPEIARKIRTTAAKVTPAMLTDVWAKLQ